MSVKKDRCTRGGVGVKKDRCTRGGRVCVRGDRCKRDRTGLGVKKDRCKRVSKLVFYAQSTSAVISG